MYRGSVNIKPMQNKQLQIVLFWFGIVMAAVFICCGIAFLLSDAMPIKLPKTNRIILGVVFIAYGSFRATRQYGQYKKTQRPDNNAE